MYHASALPEAWLTEGARIFAGVPWAAVQIPAFPLWLLLGYYVIVVGAWLTHQVEVWVPGAPQVGTGRALAEAALPQITSNQS